MYAVAQGTCLFMGIGREPCQYDCEFFTMVMVQGENPLRPLLFPVGMGQEPCQYDCEFFTMVMVQEENPLRPLLFQVRLVVP